MTSSFIQRPVRRAYCSMAIAINLVLIIAATAQPRDPERYQITVRSLEFGTPELVTYNLDGTNPRRFGPEGVDGEDPAWSPDGTQFAFYTDEDGEIFLFDMNIMRQAQLTDSSRRKMNPAWSPDGGRIAFQWILDGRHRLFVMNADGSAIIEIEPEFGGNKFDPAWSPDGNLLAFSIGDRIVLLDSETYGRTPVGVILGNKPTWSPDSRLIVVHNAEGQLLVGEAEGSVVRQLSYGEGHSSSPAWSPDGRYIAYRQSPMNPWREEVLCDLVIFDVITETHTTILRQNLPRSGSRPSWRPFPTEAAN